MIATLHGNASATNSQAGVRDQPVHYAPQDRGTVGSERSHRVKMDKTASGGPHGTHVQAAPPLTEEFGAKLGCKRAYLPRRHGRPSKLRSEPFAAPVAKVLAKHSTFLARKHHNADVGVGAETPLGNVDLNAFRNLSSVTNRHKPNSGIIRPIELSRCRTLKLTLH